MALVSLWCLKLLEEHCCQHEMLQISDPKVPVGAALGCVEACACKHESVVQIMVLAMHSNYCPKLFPIVPLHVKIPTQPKPNGTLMKLFPVALCCAAGWNNSS